MFLITLVKISKFFKSFLHGILIIILLAILDMSSGRISSAVLDIYSGLVKKKQLSNFLTEFKNFD